MDLNHGDDSAVFELRQYTLHPGQRETLIGLFERELLETQEMAGARVLGQFRDLDRPDRFVWLRGYPSLALRAPILHRFYDGPVWAQHREAANATMIDSDDVLLLRPVPGGELRLPPHRPGPDAPPSNARLTATVAHLKNPVDAALLRFFASGIASHLQQAQLLGVLQTEPSPNAFPRHPIREGLNVLVWFTTASEDGPERDLIWPELTPWLSRPLETIHLQPTARSRFGTLSTPSHPQEHAMNHAIATAILAATLTADPAAPPLIDPAFAKKTFDVHDFDFLEGGTWQMKNHRLTRRGVGSTDPKDWTDFTATLTWHKQMGGQANVDEVHSDTLGWLGMATRTFNPKMKRWLIYWFDKYGVLYPPVEGGFTGDRGEFYGDDTDEGRPVKVRFIWTRKGKNAATWEQAFSFDGKTWETNWKQELTRS